MEAGRRAAQQIRTRRCGPRAGTGAAGGRGHRTHMDMGSSMVAAPRGPSCGPGPQLARRKHPHPVASTSTAGPRARTHTYLDTELLGIRDEAAPKVEDGGVVPHRNDVARPRLCVLHAHGAHLNAHVAVAIRQVLHQACPQLHALASAGRDAGGCRLHRRAPPFRHPARQPRFMTRWGPRSWCRRVLERCRVV